MFIKNLHKFTLYIYSFLLHLIGRCKYNLYMGNPMDALMHSIISLRDLPEHQKLNWLNMFNHYVFNFDKKNFDHIPNELNGSHKEINDDLAKDLRTLLLKNLNR